MTIKLKDLLFHSLIGVEEQERIVGNEFRVNVELTYSADHFENENLESTISYAEVYALVEEEMRKEW
ncbi:MAG: dihydroneopterin aldolase [Muribaculaceae bacterium]|nr:dihydroneopterin aldolase [Muribaculaceae bacterium]